MAESESSRRLPSVMDILYVVVVGLMLVTFIVRYWGPISRTFQKVGGSDVLYNARLRSWYSRQPAWRQELFDNHERGA